MVNRKVKIAIISDVHLGTFGSRAEEVLIYLNSITPEMLIVNGDLVDIWQFRKRYFPKSHLAVLQKIFSLAANGTPVYFLPGNHDNLIRKFGDFSLGNLRIQNELFLEIDGKKVWIHHGDKYDKAVDHQRLAAFGGYIYEHLILIERGFNFLLKKMDIKPFSLTRKLKSFSKSMSKKSGDFEAKALAEAIEKECDIMICGHVHRPQNHEITNEKGSILYLNSGDWVENLTALEYDHSEWKIIRFQQPLVPVFKKDASLIKTTLPQSVAKQLVSELA